MPEPLSCNHGRWGSLCREDGARKKENRDKKTSETEEDIWRKRKAGDGEGKATHARSKPVGSTLFLGEKRVPEDCLFSCQLMKTTFILIIKEKGKGR